MYDFFFTVDLKALFIPEESLFELFLRGTTVFLMLFTLLTVIHKRHAGMLGGADFLFVLLLAASSHYALTGGSKSITAAVMVIVTIIFWNYIINFLSYHSSLFKNYLTLSHYLLLKTEEYSDKICTENL